jgi:hypothetical protein
MIIPTTDPGDTLATSYNLGIISEDLDIQGFVSDVDSIDIFRLTIANAGEYIFGLENLIADADLELLDADGEVVASSINVDDLDESIEIDLNPGEYFLNIDSFDDVPTAYNLSLSVSTSEVGSSIDTPSDIGLIGSLGFTLNDNIGVDTTSNFYEFSVGQSGIFAASLSDLTADADIRLVNDANNDGVINRGEVIAWQWEIGSNDESIRAFLEAGDYVLEVRNFDEQTTGYNVSADFTPAIADPREFNIELNVAEALNLDQPLLDALEDAAQFWENAIPYSSLPGSHTLTISIVGRQLEEGTIAQAGPINDGVVPDANDLPTLGIATINTEPSNLESLLANPEYFTRILIHEFGHVLGIGTLWDNAELIDPIDATYNADTYAGIAYGDLLGTFVPTAVPLTTGEGEGSDLSHWSEGEFDNEILTSQAGLPGELHPLSQLTIATLRDLGWNVNFGAAESYDLPDTVA